MLHIIGLILKIIGIILAVILGMLVLLVLVILFVPVRYELQGEFGGKLSDARASLKVSWLLHLIAVRAWYDGGKLHWKARAAWRRFDSDKPEEKPARDGGKTSRKAADSAEEIADEAEHDAKGGQAEAVVRKAEGNVEEARTEDVAVKAKSDVEEVRTEDAVRKAEGNVEEAHSEDVVREAESNVKEARAEDAVRKAESNVKEDRSEEVADEAEHDAIGASGEDSIVKRTGRDGEKKRFDDKERQKRKKRRRKPLRAILHDLTEKIKSFFAKIKYTFAKICDKLKTVSERKDQLIAFLEDETHKSALARVKRELVWLKRFLRPKKFRANLRFGFEDPYHTGQALAALGMIYPLIGNHMDVSPDFERRVLEGEIDLKGKLRAFHMAVLVLKVILDGNVRRTYKDIRKALSQ